MDANGSDIGQQSILSKYDKLKMLSLSGWLQIKALNFLEWEFGLKILMKWFLFGSTFYFSSYNMF